MKEDTSFFGVYLLYCVSEGKYKGDYYIGFTVDPVRRIKQHNKGVQAGGAYTTNKKGSWEMTLVVHGFPDDKSALRFEWSWQHPKRSRRLAHVPARRYKKETKYDYAVRVLSVMLSVAPWNRLSLTLQWLDGKYQQELPLRPPSHIQIILADELPKYERIIHEALPENTKCGTCSKVIFINLIASICDKCSFISHLTCLASKSTSEGFLIPIVATCRCGHSKLWNNWLRENTCQVVSNAEEA